MLETHPLLLTLRRAGLKDVDPCNVDEVHYMWNAFSKAKNCIDGGDRLEYLSWRIYSRELVRRKCLVTPETPETVHLNQSEDTCPQNPEQSDSDSNSEDEWENMSTRSSDSENISVNDDSSVTMSQETNEDEHSVAHSRSYVGRRISSVEFQHLFTDTMASRSICSNQISSDKSTSIFTGASSSKRDILKHKKDNEQLKSQIKFNHSWTQRPIAVPDRSGTSSPVVRGFSTTSVSVHRPSIPDIAKELRSMKGQDHIFRDSNSGSKDQNKKQKSSMFFIDSADSESDESSISPQNQPIYNTADDEWDDIEDENEVSEAESGLVEERRKVMFEERQVPNDPQLKPSLLSSLFLNKMNASKETKPTPGYAAVTDSQYDDQSEPNDNSVLPIASCMTARPEMIRVSTMKGSFKGKKKTWTNQHEDIYDSMNYHSRGW